MTVFHVDSDAVLSTTSAAHGSVDRIRGEVAALLSQLTSLEGSWSGAASVAFQQLVADWRATQQRVEENLVAITSALGTAGRQYAETEQANARLFGR